jgi:hypothetical protein
MRLQPRQFKDTETGFRGVTRHQGVWRGLKYGVGYRARITIQYKTVHLGVYATAQEAADAFDAAAIVRYGEHAVTNASRQRS